MLDVARLGVGPSAKESNAVSGKVRTLLHRGNSNRTGACSFTNLVGSPFLPITPSPPSNGTVGSWRPSPRCVHGHVHMPAVLLLAALMTLATGAGGGSGSLRQRLLAGGKSYGPFLMSDSPIVAELLATVGYGHVVIDHEHGVTDVRSGMRMLQAIRSGSRLLQEEGTSSSSAKVSQYFTEAVVRVPSPNDPAYMKKVLDTLPLPGGVMVPMVESADVARAVVQSTRYPAQQWHANDPTHHRGAEGGIRGNAWPLVRASLYGANTNYPTETNRDLLVMVQVETPQAVEAIPEIAQVAGVDAIFHWAARLVHEHGEDGHVRRCGSGRNAWPGRALGVGERVRPRGIPPAGPKPPGHVQFRLQLRGGVRRPGIAQGGGSEGSGRRQCRHGASLAGPSHGPGRSTSSAQS
jgi:2-keto-3-deoxy-L-rhamnonate aldolase RhmA